ncbi:CHAP domain-containing protein [Actinomadura graeca]|uniref:CHAP domain-containing protein n=1 Tax=Actinomadura graeca TaxID=2750812 RepID=A0ABX8R3K8_9ACTN|nr:CHAP domain-containing protein [Actinomadura graeca]QXJ25625.1 CHAP domain-containing protein [Actinomadura graeca]
MRKTALLASVIALWTAPAVPLATAVAAEPAPPAAGGPVLKAGDDYPYRNGDWDKPDRWNFFQRECTSFAAWRLNQRGVRFNNNYKGVRWSNASNWDDAARRARIRVDKNPTVGSIAQWNSGRFGHVAYVARSSGGTVLVEEYNRRGTHRYGQREIRVREVENFIHIAR